MRGAFHEQTGRITPAHVSWVTAQALANQPLKESRADTAQLLLVGKGKLRILASSSMGI